LGSNQADDGRGEEREADHIDGFDVGDEDDFSGEWMSCWLEG
jgi:hypothetical protein